MSRIGRLRFLFPAVGPFDYEVGLFGYEVGQFYDEVGLFRYEVGQFYDEVGLFRYVLLPCMPIVPLYMQSIQVGSTMVAEIMYAKW